MENISRTLTVMVTNPTGGAAEGARVSLNPGGASGLTGANGEVPLELGQALKYEVTVQTEGTTVTVPYYVTQNGATRLVVNPSYVKSVEQQSKPRLKIDSDYFSSLNSSTILAGLGVIVALILVWKLWRRYR